MDLEGSLLYSRIMTPKKLLCGISFVLLLPLSLSAGTVVDEVIAIVNDDIITLSDLTTPLHHGYLGSLVFETKKPLDQRIYTLLLDHEIKTLGLSTEAKDTKMAMEQYLQKHNLAQGQLTQHLQQKNLTYNEFQEELKKEILRMKFIGQVIYPRIRISEKELEALAKNGTDPQARALARYQIAEQKVPGELENYLKEVRKNASIELRESWNDSPKKE